MSDGDYSKCSKKTAAKTKYKIKLWTIFTLKGFYYDGQKQQCSSPKKLSKCYSIIDTILFKIHSNIFSLQKNR